MKKVIFLAAMFFVLSLPVQAQAVGFGGGYGGPGWHGGGYGRSGIARHEFRERQRLERHQRREFRHCRLYGDCRHLRAHQRREWRRLERHQRFERRDFRPW